MPPEHSHTRVLFLFLLIQSKFVHVTDIKIIIIHLYRKMIKQFNCAYSRSSCHGVQISGSVAGDIKHKTFENYPPAAYNI